MTVATDPGGGSAATKSWKYQGRLDVAASGPALYDFEAREMSPGLGSFTSNDTVLGSATNPRQLNRYVYAGANPTTLIDPDGHRILSDWEAYEGGTAGTVASGSQNVTSTGDKHLADSNEDGRSGTLAKTVGSTPTTVQKKDCGWGGLACVGAFLGGLGESVVNFGVGAAVFTGCAAAVGMHMAFVGSACQQSIFDPMSESIGNGIRGLVTNPGGTIGSALMGAADWVGREHELLNSADSTEAAAEAGRLFGGIELEGLSTIYGIKGAWGAIKGARAAEGAAAEAGGIACSFTGDTPVLTPSGSAAISSLAVGDTVMAWDEGTNRVVQRAITAVMPHPDDEIATLILSTGRVTTTPDHPFYALGVGWVEVGLLRPGMHVKTPTGAAEVQFVKARPYSGTLWDHDRGCPHLLRGIRGLAGPQLPESVGSTR